VIRDDVVAVGRKQQVPLTPADVDRIVERKIRAPATPIEKMVRTAPRGPEAPSRRPGGAPPGPP
jgi:hypothetical protein